MNIEQLGPPSIRLGGLQIWVHSPETSITPAPWEDWLSATVHCGASGADVWVHGSILTLTAIKRWAEDCEKINRNLSGHAVLDGIEPELLVTMEVSDRLGHLKVNVSITPDYLRQQHKFEFELDQSYLPSMIEECKTVLSNFGLKVDTP
jgi:hypothetical protein